ncbi:MAG: quinoprotein relay system zinc metallohydrolase 2 [Hyphomicrobiaceae bacterium]
MFRSKLHRRKFLQTSTAIAALSLLPKSVLSAQNSEGLSEIASGVFVHTGHHGLASDANHGDISNASIIVGKDAVAVIDTSSTAKMGKALLDEIRKVTQKPIRYVINTHMHPDHVLGNAAFKAEGTAFVAHHKMARGLTSRAEGYLNGTREAVGEENFAGTEIVLPNIAIKEEKTLDLGDRIIKLKARPTAHTDNDLTIYDETTKTIILGDLLFSEHIPTLDGSIVGWLKLIDVMKSESAERVIPGHGPNSLPWPTALEPLKAYLATIAKEVRAQIAQGQTLSHASKTVGTEAKAAWLFHEQYHGRNVAAAFAELEWE